MGTNFIVFAVTRGPGDQTHNLPLSWPLSWIEPLGSDGTRYLHCGCLHENLAAVARWYRVIIDLMGMFLMPRCIYGTSSQSSSDGTGGSGRKLKSEVLCLFMLLFLQMPGRDKESWKYEVIWLYNVWWRKCWSVVRETPTVPPAIDLTSYIIFCSRLKVDERRQINHLFFHHHSSLLRVKGWRACGKAGLHHNKPWLGIPPMTFPLQNWNARISDYHDAKKRKRKMLMILKSDINCVSSIRWMWDWRLHKLNCWYFTGITEGPADWDVDPNVWKFNDIDEPFAYVVMNYETFLTYTPLTTLRYEAFLLLL